jgi:hypothetical protein
MDAANVINAGMPNSSCTVKSRHSDLVVLEVTFTPTRELAAHDYPEETVRVAQFADRRHLDPYCFPIGESRSWHHRYPIDPAYGFFGQLCLWYPEDPPHLRWEWDRGLLDFIAISQRHVWFEEFYRRTGHWPVEDAPHNHRPDGRPHPIRTPTYQQERP